MQSLHAQETAVDIAVNSELKHRHERLSLYAPVLVEYIGRINELDHGQLTAVSTIVGSAVDRCQQRYRTRRLEKFQSEYIEPNQIPMPIYFTSAFGAASEIMDQQFIEQLRSTLTSIQWDRYQKSLQERQTQLTGGLAQKIVNQIDLELLLSSKQRESISDTVVEQLSPLNDALYALPAESMHDFASAGAKRRIIPSSFFDRIDTLSTPQRNFIQEIYSPDFKDRNYVSERNLSSLTTSGFLETCEKEEARLRRRTDLQLSFLNHQTTGGLGDSASRRLNLVIDGLILRAMRDPKIKGLAAFSRNTNELNWYGSYFPNSSQVLADPLWPAALKRAGADFSFAQRKKEREIAEAEYIFAVIDQELWLSGSQRQSIHELVISLAPGIDVLDEVEGQQRYGWTKRLHAIGWVVAQLTEEQLAPILSQPQMDVWKYLRTRFEIRNGGLWFRAYFGQIRITKLNNSADEIDVND